METRNLTVGEITQMAITMEEKGMHFYTWAAGQFQDISIKNMFSRLAEEEKEHAGIFRKILSLPESGEPVKTGRESYFRLLADTGDIFPSHSEITRDNIKRPADALAYGIQAEKDAILFYQELYNSTESEKVRDTLSKLLEQEKIHLVELRDTMDELKFSQTT